MRLKKQRALCLERLEDRCVPSADFIIDWNKDLLDVQRQRGQGNQQSARALAMMGVAIYDSVNAISPTHTYYHEDARSFPGASTASGDAAAAQAAYTIAVNLYNQDAQRFKDRLDAQLGTITEGTAKDNGKALGEHVALGVLDWRAHDHSDDTITYTAGTDPGDWRPTPPNFTPAPQTPHWPNVTPFALESGSQFRSGPPPALTSADYTAAFNEVKAIGSINSTTRTAEQTEIAKFWAGGGVPSPASNGGVGIWNQITQTVAKGLSLADTARLFAQVGVANADAFIASFDVKYTYNYWRPVTAIRAADTDGNPATAKDEFWTPLIATPNHPSYGSNHSAQSRAAAEALAAFFGTDQVRFTATAADMERSFKKFTEAAKEAGKSRIFAGIHWSFDCSAGESLGRKIGRYIADNFFQPLGDQLQAADAAPSVPVGDVLRADQVRPLLVEALARWQAAGADVSALRGVDVRVADLGGRTLGMASGNTVWLDDDAAGWGWFVDQTPWDDSEFALPGDQGEAGRMDLLTALEHELGHLLGRDHEEGGVMTETLSAGVRRQPGGVAAPAWSPEAVFALFAAEATTGRGGKSW